MELRQRIYMRIRMAYLIKQARLEKNMSLFALSRKLDLPLAELLKYELGIKSPSAMLIAKMLQELKSSMYLYMSFCCFPLKIDRNTLSQNKNK